MKRIKNYRKEILIAPTFQLKVMASFIIPVLFLAGINFYAFLHFSNKIKESLLPLAKTNPEKANELFELLDSFCNFFSLSNSFLLFLLLVIGVIVTFRIAGPVYNIKKYFNEADPNNLQEIKLRKGDMLKDLSDTYNKNLHKFKKD